MKLFKAIKKQLSLSILHYLRFWARLQLKKDRATIIGVTGTSGKTSTCSAIGEVLSSNLIVKTTHKANSESGLPLNILNLSMNNYSVLDWLRVIVLAPFQILFYWPKHQVYVAEMAIDSPHSPKNMSYLLSILQPTVGVFLNVSTVHGENFDNLAKSQDSEKRRREVVQLIANEKGKLIQGLPKKGLAVLNIDDKNVFKFKTLAKANTVSFGKNEAADIQFTGCKQSLAGTSFAFKIKGHELTANWPNYLLPEHYGYTFAAALAVGSNFKIEPSAALTSLEKNLTLPPGRSSLIKGINGSLIIDSSYNSSINPLLDFLKLLSEVTPKRKLALLGDMRELGQQIEGDHLRAAQVIANNCDLVFLVGPEMKKYVLPYLKQKNITCTWHENTLEAANKIKTQLLLGDVILVKGSQNEIFLEAAIEKLMAEPAQAEKLLCRRGEFWDKKRYVTFKV